MKNHLFLIFVLALFIGSTFLMAATVNVTGKWELTIKSPRGERTRTYEFKQEGEDLTVIMEGRDGNKVEAKGTVKDNNIEWSLTRETPRGEFTISYKGTVDGDTMKGEAQMGNFGAMEWSAKKQTDK
jgi:hypothetical protein